MAAPEDSSDPATTTYIVVTGANSGLGFAICCRLIDEFLPTRPSTHTLHLIPTTRGQSKADDTVVRLRRHLSQYIRNESSSAPQEALDILEVEIGKRVIITPELVDLNSILSVQQASKRIKGRYERIDVLVCNAGIGGWLGVDFVGAAKQFFTEGLNFLKEPKYKIGAVGWVTKSQIPSEESSSKQEEPKLGEVFCANVFGHYLLSHYLMSLLSRPKGGEPGRIIWVTTLEAYKRTFNMEDFQGLETNIAYESSKRLTDLLVLSADLPSTSPYTKSFFSTSTATSSSPPGLSASWEDLTPRKASLRSSTRNGTSTPPTSLQPQSSQTEEQGVVKPKMYLSHPGMCVTGIMPIHWILIYVWIGVFYISRVCGSPWHTTTAYPAATSMTWLALADQETLDEMEASPETTTDKDNGVESGKTKKKGEEGRLRRAVKWGSAVNWVGKERVKKSEADGWCDDKGVAIKDQEEKTAFEESARECWRRMEELRVQWEERLKKAGHDELS